MCYIHSMLEWRQVGWVGDSLEDLSLHLFADADFAGCTSSSRSTSGVHLCIRGPATCYPLNGISKRQGCVSHSTPEAEIVAGDFALRSSGLPALDLWTVICMCKVVLTFHEDNQAMIRVCETGRNPTMRHLGRTHRVSVDWLHERCSADDIDLIPETTDRQAADIYTKTFTNPDKWRHATEAINVFSQTMLKSIAMRGAIDQNHEITTLCCPTTRCTSTNETVADGSHRLPNNHLQLTIVRSYYLDGLLGDH